MEIVIILAVLALVVFLCYKFKIPKTDCVGLITGGVKTGKSMLSVYMAIRKFKAQRFKWKIKTFFQKLFHLPLSEEPLLYSNVPLAGIEFTLLTKDALERKVRLAKGSVTYIQEASLLADSMMYKDMELNERLQLFNKLYGHECGGGSSLIYDTQAVVDLHFSIKRCLNSFIYIHHSVNIPFFKLLYVRELHYSDDTNSINVFNEDVEDSLKLVIVPKSVWKKYDAYCYSALTDDLPLLRKPRFIPKLKKERKKLKIKDILSFRTFKTLPKNGD